MKKVAIVMGSDSDLKKIAPAIQQLDDFGIPREVRVISAHRTPYAAAEFASTAREKGFGVIIAAAGKAAHLAGVLAAHTTLPVIGVPISATHLDGMDALLATVQMPSGVPVATVAIDGGKNAAILATQILALGDETLTQRLLEMKHEQQKRIEQVDKEMKERWEQ